MPDWVYNLPVYRDALIIIDYALYLYIFGAPNIQFP